MHESFQTSTNSGVVWQNIFKYAVMKQALMNLNAALKKKTVLEDAITNFENSLALDLELKGHNPLEAHLPEYMRLTDYFLANSSDTQYCTIHQKADFQNTTGGRNDFDTSNGLVLTAGNSSLKHNLEVHGHKRISAFYREVLTVGPKGNGFESPDVRIVSAHRRNHLGRGRNLVNMVGAIVYIDIDNFFDHFLAKNTELDYDRSEYSVKAHGLALIATPKGRVNVHNIQATLEDLVDISNQVLKILDRYSYKPVIYLKTPA
jgi:hypothetical protein